MALRGTFNGGIMISSSSLIALTVATDEQGTAYGLQQSANFLGMGIGPFLGGSIASLLTLRAIFPVSAGLYFLMMLPDFKK